MNEYSRSKMTRLNYCTSWTLFKRKWRKPPPLITGNNDLVWKTNILLKLDWKHNKVLHELTFLPLKKIFSLQKRKSDFKSMSLDLKIHVFCC